MQRDLMSSRFANESYVIIAQEILEKLNFPIMTERDIEYKPENSVSSSRYSQHNHISFEVNGPERFNHNQGGFEGRGEKPPPPLKSKAR